MLFLPFTYLPGFLVRLFLHEPDLCLGDEKEYFYFEEQRPRKQQLGNTLFAVEVLGKKFTLCRYTLPDQYRGAHCLGMNGGELGTTTCCYKRR